MGLHPKSKNRNHYKDPEALQPKCITHAPHPSRPLAQSSLSKEKAVGTKLQCSHGGRRVSRALGGNTSIKPFFGKCEEHSYVGEASGLLLPSVAIYASAEVLRSGEFYKNNTILLYIIMRKEVRGESNFLKVA